jgi:hypothetical protein
MHVYAVRVEYRDVLGRIVEDFDSLFLSRDPAHARKDAINESPDDHGMVAFTSRYSIREDKPWAKAPGNGQFTSDSLRAGRNRSVKRTKAKVRQIRDPNAGQFTSESSRGEGNSKAKLTEAKVREIRARRAAGDPVADIAKDLGVIKGTVYHVLSGRNWAHV